MQQAKVCLAPIQYGAGLKGKLIDAMQNGTPLVTTNIGAEGVYKDMLPNGFITDNPKDFANHAIRLYENEVLWNEKKDNGFKVINTRFDKFYFQKKLQNKISETIKNIDNKRLENFTGQMFLHHTLQSTKFMGKWIEEKKINAIKK